MALPTGPDTVYQLKITLGDVRPPVWRRVQVKDCTLGKLHHVIQVCMGWQECHLHVFEVGRVQYAEPDPEGTGDHKSERSIKLSRIVAEGHTKFSYTYDFGDNWDHTIAVEKTLPAEPHVGYPHCVTGKRACPPEDCGGPSGYADFLDAVRDPGHQQHAELLEWVGGEFDPEAFDLAAVNRELHNLHSAS